MTEVIVLCDNDFIYAGLEKLLLQKYSDCAIKRVTCLSLVRYTAFEVKRIYIYCITGNCLSSDIMSFIKSKENCPYTTYQFLITDTFFNVYKNLQYSFKNLTVLNSYDSMDVLYFYLCTFRKRDVCKKRYEYGNILGVTTMQYQVITHLASGFSQNKIAGDLKLSNKTVSAHKLIMLRSLNLKLRSEYNCYLQMCRHLCN